MKAVLLATLVFGLSMTSFGSVGSSNFCLKKYSKQTNRYTASLSNQARKTNFAAAEKISTASADKLNAVKRQK